jgi:hypothetical protein
MRRHGKTAMSYKTRKIKARRERGRKLSNIRWERDRAHRAALAAIDPVRFEVVLRIVVVDHETSVREIVFYEHDRYTDRKRKLREAGALSLP